MDIDNLSLTSRLVRFKILLMGYSLLLLLTSCNTHLSSTTPTTVSTISPIASPTRYVVATAYTALLIGKLVDVDGCLRVVKIEFNSSFALAWPPDVTYVLDGDKVRVISGLVTGQRKEVELQIGEMVLLGGAANYTLDSQLRQTVPSNCSEPYWIVGFTVMPYQAAEEPK